MLGASILVRAFRKDTTTIFPWMVHPDQERSGTDANRYRLEIELLWAARSFPRPLSWVWAVLLPFTEKFTVKKPLEGGGGSVRSYVGYTAGVGCRRLCCARKTPREGRRG